MIPDLSKLPFDRFEWVNKTPDLVNKILLVEFLASWCPPCQATIEHLNNIYLKYKQYGLEVVGITAEDKENIENFIDKFKINYSIAITYYEDFKEYFDKIPYLIFMSRDKQQYWEGFPLSLTELEIKSLILKENDLARIAQR